MQWIRMAQYVWLAVVLVVAVRHLRNGYRRRRPYWSRGSWARFTATFALGLAITFLPALVELAIGLGWWARPDLTTNALGLWAVAFLACISAGTGTLVWTMRHFSHGDPEEPFPGTPTSRTPP